MSAKIFYGWWIVLACAIIYTYCGGTYFYGFTAIFNPIVEEFGWSYALVSLAFSFRGFEAGVIAPIIGIYVDRFGPRKLLLCGMSIMGLGFLLFSHIHSLWSFYIVFLALGLGLSLASPVVTMTAVVRWFRKRTTLAMGFLTAGLGVGGLLVPGVVWLIDRFGWREALTIFGIGAWLLGIPLALVVKNPPRERYSPEKASSARDERPEGVTARVAIMGRNFWLLSTAVLLGGVAGMAVTVHQIPYLVSMGTPRQTAGLLASAFALANVIGRLGFGWLGDILDKRWCFAIAAFIKGIGVLGFSLANSVGQFVPSLIALGIGFGGVVPLRPALQVELFGTKAFGTLQGMLMVFITVGSMMSPLFAGWMFDITRSYRLAFLVLAIVTLTAVPTVLALSRRS